MMETTTNVTGRSKNNQTMNVVINQEMKLSTKGSVMERQKIKKMTWKR